MGKVLIDGVKVFGAGGVPGPRLCAASFELPTTVRRKAA